MPCAVNCYRACACWHSSVLLAPRVLAGNRPGAQFVIHFKTAAVFEVSALSSHLRVQESLLATMLAVVPGEGRSSCPNERSGKSLRTPGGTPRWPSKGTTGCPWPLSRHGSRDALESGVSPAIRRQYTRSTARKARCPGTYHLPQWSRRRLEATAAWLGTHNARQSVSQRAGSVPCTSAKLRRPWRSGTLPLAHKPSL